MEIEGIITEDCQSFVDEINRGGLVKPSDIGFVTCAIAWDAHIQIMDSLDTKSLFLSSKIHRRMFFQIVHEKTIGNMQ